MQQMTFLRQKISELELLAIAGKSSELIEHLCEVVPTFQPLHPSATMPRLQAQESLALVPKNGA